MNLDGAEDVPERLHRTIRLRVPNSTQARRYVHRWKRLVDIVLLVVLGPLAIVGLGVTAVALLVMEPGRPVLFSQSRAGRDHVPFTMYKFRTMIPDADRLHVPFSKGLRDPRVTRIGQLLRRLSLDELPQLINIAKGEMSFVGPRPLPLDEVAKLSPEFDIRYSVPPGLTGLWQISGRSNTSLGEWMALDTHYVLNVSARLDMAILLATVGVVLSGDGAY